MTALGLGQVMVIMVDSTFGDFSVTDPVTISLDLPVVCPVTDRQKYHTIS